MPTIEWNKEQWGHRTNWDCLGDGWSTAWGGAVMEWYGSILPRIQRFLPGQRILEIACGYGRWTQFLKDRCDHLVAIDLIEKCVDACKQRFAKSSNISYFVNDGKSLDMVADDSVDFIFSFDSLVHAEPAIIKTYISQFPRILRNGGGAFLHHSNLGQYPHYQKLARMKRFTGLLGWIGVLERNTHNREPSMSAQRLAEYANEFGLDCLSQELVNWGTRSALIDCFSMIGKCVSSSVSDTVVLRNPNFMIEARQLLRLSSAYGSVRPLNPDRRSP